MRNSARLSQSRVNVDQQARGVEIIGGEGGHGQLGLGTHVAGIARAHGARAQNVACTTRVFRQGGSR